MTSKTPLVLLHGFAQTSTSWQTTIELLQDDRDVHAIELLGHGATALTRGQPTVESVRNDVLAQLDQSGVDVAILWGYSQGARVALDLALHARARTTGLILESGLPGIEDPVARADRRSRDFALASRIEASPIEAFVEMWEQIPALSGQSRQLIDQQRPDRLTQDPIALAAALRGIGQAAFDPMWRQLPSIDRPTLLVTGARDAVYTAHAKRMLELLPDATHVVVDDAGHAVHLAQPATTAAVVSRFLDDRFS